MAECVFSCSKATADRCAVCRHVLTWLLGGCAGHACAVAAKQDCIRTASGVAGPVVLPVLGQLVVALRAACQKAAWPLVNRAHITQSYLLATFPMADVHVLLPSCTKQVLAGTWPCCPHPRACNGCRSALLSSHGLTCQVVCHCVSLLRSLYICMPVRMPVVMFSNRLLCCSTACMHCLHGVLSQGYAHM